VIVSTSASATRAGAEHPDVAGVERAGRRVDRRGEFERVGRLGQQTGGRADLRFALAPPVGGQRLAQVRRHAGGHGEFAERAAEPLAVGRPPAFHQEADPHQVAGDPRGEDGRAEVVPGAPDERLLQPCVTSLQEAQGNEVTTIEGLADGDTLHPVQEAWLAQDVAQCGYCQPGQTMAAVALLRRTPNPTDEDIDRIGNVYRCGMYFRIRRAIKEAAADMA
jgi:aerobic-type carbon monoxide dehydrogenase small subunit (CoxS/CutS family)